MEDFIIWDGRRDIAFHGELIGESTSRVGASPRWIEFRLYRTQAGTYIIERVGKSLIFHRAGCMSSPAARTGGDGVNDVPSNSVPCTECRPVSGYDVFYPEQDRPWVVFIDSAEGVVESLYRRDPATGAKYLTRVVVDLLEDAAEKDDDIENVYGFETIA